MDRVLDPMLGCLLLFSLAGDIVKYFEINPDSVKTKILGLFSIPLDALIAGRS